MKKAFEDFKIEHERVEDECRNLRSQISDIKECQICNERFDHEAHQPVKVNCGHILYCKECMLQIAKTDKKCPACRAPFKAKHIQRVNLSFV